MSNLQQEAKAKWPKPANVADLLNTMKKLQKQLEKNQIRAVNAWAKYRKLGGHACSDDNAAMTRALRRAEKWSERAENMRREIIATEECRQEKKRQEKNFNAMLRD